MLVTVGGWIASGKSTVARGLADELSAELLVADEIRAEHAAGGEPAYVPGFSSVVYADLFARAREALTSRRSVVLDGTFRDRDVRGRARALASDCGATFRFVECRAGEDVCRARLRAREDAGSPGWVAMFEHFLPLWEDPDEIPAAEHEVVDTSGVAPHPSATAPTDARSS
ncbi:MAG: ATP-binding protein [Myxococcota bacterium]|nr:ATP-binding protein [Myxococcota bacterium]